MIEPTNTLNSDKVKCMSNIPAGYFMVVGTTGQVPYRPAGTSHCGNYSIAEVGVKLKFFNKKALEIFERTARAGKNWYNNEQYKRINK